MQEDFYINQWLVQPGINRISLKKDHWKLEPKIMQVLCALAEKPGQVVSRDELFNTIWKDTIVVDMVLTRAISELRRVFKDVPTAPGVIETIPKGGYRLIAEVKPAKQKTAGHRAIINTDPGQLHQWKYAFASALGLVAALVTFLASGSATKSDLKHYDLRPFTSLKGWEFHPDIAPDGNSVAYIWQRPGEQTTSLCIKSIGADDHRVVLENSGYNLAPKWSPDGNQIACYHNDRGRVSIKLITLYNEQEEELLSLSSQVASLSWSPDGRQLSYVDKNSEGQHAIFMYNIEQRKSCPLSQPGDKFWGDTSPRFSPDGSRLAFVRSLAEGVQDIYLINLESKAEQRLTEKSSAIYGINWSGNDQIIFSSDRDGQIHLWEFSADAPDQMHKLPFSRNRQNPDYHKGKLIFEDWQTEADLWSKALGPDSMVASALIQSTQWELHPDISLDGQKMAFSSNRSGTYEIWSANIDGSRAKRLTHIENAFTANPAWAPKGDMIAFDSKADGYTHIYLIDSSGQDQYQFTRGEYNDLSPNWALDGSQLYFTSDRTGNWEIWKKPTNGNKAVQVTQNGGYAARQSTDGKTLYFTRHRQNGLWELDLGSGAEKLLIENLSAYDWNSWSVGKNGIYFPYRTQSQTSLAHFNLASNSIDRQWSLKGRFPTQDRALAISPDESLAIIGRMNGYKGDLILVENY